MPFARWSRILAPILLSLLLFVTACSSQPSRYSEVQKDTTRWGAPGAVAKGAEKGGTFNKFFPGATGGYEVVPAQEKKGFAEYKLNKEGKTVAVMSINDTAGLPTAAAKYQNSTQTVAGYPSVEQGTTTTGLLVNDRYQVKVLSRDPEFTQEDRVAWLQKFDLRGLAKLEGVADKTAEKNKRNLKPTATAKPVQPAPPIAKPALAPAAAAPRLAPATAQTTPATDTTSIVKQMQQGLNVAQPQPAS
jgi:hypothetical protein